MSSFNNILCVSRVIRPKSVEPFANSESYCCKRVVSKTGWTVEVGGRETTRDAEGSEYTLAGAPVTRVFVCDKSVLRVTVQRSISTVIRNRAHVGTPSSRV